MICRGCPPPVLANEETLVHWTVRVRLPGEPEVRVSTEPPGLEPTAVIDRSSYHGAMIPLGATDE